MQNRSVAFSSARRTAVAAKGLLTVCWLLALPSFGQVFVGEGLDTTSASNVVAWERRFKGQDDFIKEAEFFADLLRVQGIMQDPARALAALDPLARAVNANLAAHPGRSTVQALEAELTRIEASHCFSAARVVPVGILSEKEFFELPAKGFILSDIGAGVEHGEYAHRLQWAMIMENFEGDTGKWNYTPLQLFSKIFERDLLVSKAQPQTSVSLWSHLFDQAKVGFPDGNPTKPNLFHPDGYRHPDRLTQDLRIMAERADADPTLRNSTLFSIADAVRARFVQRDALRASLAGTNKTFSEAIRDELEGSYTELAPNSKVLVNNDDIADVRAEFKNPRTTQDRVAASWTRWYGPEVTDLDPTPGRLDRLENREPSTPVRSVGRLRPGQEGIFQDLGDEPPRPGPPRPGGRAPSPSVDDDGGEPPRPERIKGIDRENPLFQDADEPPRPEAKPAGKKPEPKPVDARPPH